MPHRDDHDAALARIASLEIELERARRTPSKYEGDAALSALCAAYVTEATGDAADVALLALVEDELLPDGDRPAVRKTLGHMVAALRIEGKTFAPAMHAGLDRALRTVLERAAVIDRVIARR